MIVCILFPIINIQAQEVDTKGQVLIVNLNDAYNLLEKNNLDIKLLNKKIDIAIKKNETALKASKDAIEKYSYSETTNIEYRKDEKLNWKVTKLDLEDLNNQRSILLKDLKNSIKQQYINVLLSSKDAEILNSEIQNIDKKLNELQIRMKLGQVKETDYKQVLAQKLSLQNQMNDINRQNENAQNKLKSMLGIEIKEKIKLENMNLPYEAIDENELANKIDIRSNTDFNVYKLNQQLENKKIEKQIIIDYAVNKNISTIDTSIAELEKKIGQQVIDNQVKYWNDYYNILSLNANVELEELNLELEKLNYDAVMTKSKLGIVDVATESNARVSYNRQENSVQRAKYNYILAVEKFNEELEIQ